MPKDSDSKRRRFTVRYFGASQRRIPPAQIVEEQRHIPGYSNSDDILRCEYVKTPDILSKAVRHFLLEHKRLRKNAYRTIHLPELFRRLEAESDEPQDEKDEHKDFIREEFHKVVNDLFDHPPDEEYVDKIVKYVESVIPEAFEDALELLLEEARICVSLEHGESPDPFDVELIVKSYRTYLRTRTGVRRKSTPRKRTPHLGLEAYTLFHQLHDRVKQSSKDYTRHKKSDAWAKHVALDDQKRPGKPKLPKEAINDLPLKPAREIALEWAAAILNKRHPDLGATPNTVKGLMKFVNGSQNGARDK